MTHHLPRRTVLLVAVTITGVLFLLLAWRGTPAIASSVQTLRISARAHMVLRFNTSRLRAHPGRIRIVMHDPADAGMSHGIALSGHGVRRIGRIVFPGHSSSITVTLRRGRYTYFCPVPGHEQAGMRGTLTVS